MKKHSKPKSSAIAQVDPYLEGLVAKLLERFVGLEKKMDMVIAQTAGRPLGAGNPAGPIQTPVAAQPPRRERLLYEAVCADCHKVCEVPFKPSEDRPVYCKECFAKRRASGGGGPSKTYPILTPVAMPSKPIGKDSAPIVPASPNPTAKGASKKTKKNRAAKKVKKK